jgi:hypothetical protein
VVSDLAAVVVLIGAYVTCAVLKINLGYGRRISLAAVFAPAVALFANDLEVEGRSVVVMGSLLAAAALILAKNAWLEVAWHPFLMAACWAITHGVMNVAGSVSPTNRALQFVIAASLGTLVYSSLEAVCQGYAEGGRAWLQDAARVWLTLEAVLVSTSGLTILVFREIGWPALLAALAVLVITKREFDNFGAAHDAYGQTVRAVDRLSTGRRANESILGTHPLTEPM